MYNKEERMNSMKQNKRFIITEIYLDGIYAVDKVLVDTQTKVSYLLHQEGGAMGLVPLIDAKGLPLLCEDLTPLNQKKEEPKKESYPDMIQERKKKEKIKKLKPVKVKKNKDATN